MARISSSEMMRPSVFSAGAGLVVLVMTSLTFDTTEVFILSANSALTGLERTPVSPALTACCCAVFFNAASGRALAAGLAAVAATALSAFAAGAAVLAAGAFGAALTVFLAAAFGAAFT